LLQEEGDLDYNLNDQQWLLITNLKFMLQPFMIAQRLLGGESYITVSLIPYLVYKIRKGLLNAIGNHQASHHVIAIRKGLLNAIGNHQASHHVIAASTKMLQKLNGIFGTGEEGTRGEENNRLEDSWHPKGIPMLVLIASLLDPRMKSGISIPPLDREHIWGEIQVSLVRIALEDDEQVQQQPALNEDVDEEDCRQPDAVLVMNEAVENMFDELNDLYQAEQQRRNNNNHHYHWNVQQQFEAFAGRVIDAAIAELTLYRDEPSLPLQNVDGSFSCPLRWWKNNKAK
jgi:hypothetical protein